MSAVEIKFQSKRGNVALRRNIPEVGSQGRSNFSPKGIRNARRRGNRRTPSWGGGGGGGGRRGRKRDENGRRNVKKRGRKEVVRSISNTE
ncbi:hypothetical protein SDJN03_21150, partial [Cucurbita argyrosperma subsp. sororia]